MNSAPIESAPIESALRRYQVMAWIVGTLLVVLALIGVPLKYLAPVGSDPQRLGDGISMYVGITHGWLFMVYLVLTAMLAAKARWNAWFTLTTMAAGLIPLFTFCAERRATRVVRAAHPEVMATP
jgi:integral membrane protein